MNTDQAQRLAGSFVGLAIGDAVGTTLEFTPHSDVGYGLTDMVGGGPFNLNPGQWTDDTSMALCLAESLLACGGFDARDQLRRYVLWAIKGENSSVPGHLVDIGTTVSTAINAFYRNGTLRVADDPMGEGNGSLMRLAPLAIYYHNDATMAQVYANQMSHTTHGGTAAASACEAWALLINAASRAERKSDVFALLDVISIDDARIAKIAKDRTYTRTAADVRGDGYVVLAFEAALWAFYHTDNFRDAVLAAANLGEDADTTAAIVGSLAGAFYGLDGIPSRWRELLYDGDRIERIAFDLVMARD